MLHIIPFETEAFYCHFSNNPYPADHDYCRFQSAFLADQVTDIGNEIRV